MIPFKSRSDPILRTLSPQRCSSHHSFKLRFDRVATARRSDRTLHDPDACAEMRQMIRKHLKTIVILVMVESAALAQTRPYTPEKGSAERKAITDALRLPVQKKLKQEIVFKFDHLMVQNGWSFLVATPQKSDGGAIDYRDTPYADAYNAGAFDNSVVALLHKVGGQWRVVQYVIGATDVPYVGWEKKFRAPKTIFPH